MDVSILQVMNLIGAVMVDDMIDTAGKHSWIHAPDLSLMPHFVNKWKYKKYPWHQRQIQLFEFKLNPRPHLPASFCTWDGHAWCL